MIITFGKEKVTCQPYDTFNATMKYFSNGDIEVLLDDNVCYVHSNGGKKKMEIGNITEEQRELYRYQARIRAGVKVREYVKENNLRYLWSLTYAENMKDREKALYDFTNFKQRLDYKLDEKTSYVAVVERQKRGAIHFHVAVDKHIDHKVMEKAWKHGFVFVSKFNGELDQVAGYMSKYIKKDMREEYRPEKKQYLSSKGLKRPVKDKAYLTQEERQEIENIASVSVRIKDDEENEIGKTWCKFNIKKQLKEQTKQIEKELIEA